MPKKQRKKRRKPKPYKLWSKKELEKEGYIVGDVEKVIPYNFIKQDFLGFADLLAIHPDVPGVLAVQVSAQCDLGVHRKKFLTNKETSKNIRTWLKCGNDFMIWTWADAKTPERWNTLQRGTHLKRNPFTLADLKKDA